MQVQESQAGNIQHFLRQNLSVRRDYGQIQTERSQLINKFLISWYFSNVIAPPQKQIKALPGQPGSRLVWVEFDMLYLYHKQEPALGKPYHA